MRRFLFSTTSGYGHFHPLVPLANALKQRGHEVAFAARPSQHSRIEAAGFTFLLVSGDDPASDSEYREVKAQLAEMPLGLEAELFGYPRLFCGIATRLRTPQLVEIARAWQPDMVIREAAEYSALIAAEHLGLPHAAVSFAASLKGMAIFEREAALQLDPVRRNWGLEPDPSLKAPYRFLHLCYSPPSFSSHPVEWPGAEGSIPPTTHFIRPDFFDNAGAESLPTWVERLLATGRPTVYVTLGTEVSREPGVYPDVLQTIVAGVRQMPVNLIVTVGRDKDPSELGPQPANVHVERYIPQSLLLPYCDLAVMHAGSNSLLQAIDAGLPMVLVPLIADQFFNAGVAQSLRLGQVVHREQLTPSSMRATAEDVLTNPTYRQKVGQLQAEMHSLPDQQYAADLVENLLCK